MTAYTARTIGVQMFDLTTVIVVGGAFLIAGAVKGVIGLGLPTVSLGLLTVALDLQTAMALLLVPSFVTNLWQSVVGGKAKLILHRLWPFLLMATVDGLDRRGRPDSPESFAADRFARHAARLVFPGEPRRNAAGDPDPARSMGWLP